MRSASEIVRSYWEAAEARDWAAFAALLAPEVVYELPQTRERIQGRAKVVRVNEEYPGDWHVVLVEAIGEDRRAATWITFAVGDEEQPGLCFFELGEDGLILRITDFWPEPYDPPAGREHLVERY
jgi:ketosteroid isomerase-like protein